MFRAIQKFSQLPFTDEVLLVQTGFCLLVIQAGLTLFTFPRIYRWMKHTLRSPRHRINSAYTSGDICWAVTRMGRFLYGDEGCLVQAILGEWWLTKLGVSAKFCIGVNRKPDGGLLAHAWVESDGQVLIGGVTNQIPDDFQNFPDLHNVIG
jgi:hypothetical protein